MVMGSEMPVQLHGGSRAEPFLLTLLLRARFPCFCAKSATRSLSARLWLGWNTM